MYSTSRISPRLPLRFSSRPRKCAVPLALTWFHAGKSFRVTPWPEVQVECRYGTEWIPISASAEVATAAAGAAPAAWRAYLEFAPVDVRDFLGLFRANRLAALQVAARCPDLVGCLTDAPALTPFVAAHAGLRGTEGTRWSELNAVFERGGVYGVLEWLGLPASHQTLAVLRNVVAPDLPVALLEPLRATLWQPRGLIALAQLPAITPRDLTDACNVLAA